MKQVQRAKTAAAPRGLLSRALVVLTLIAFTLQGFLTQTHIHATPVGAPVAVDVFDGSGSSTPDKAPSKNDPGNCPLCQQFASSGNFVTPSAAAMLVPSLSVSVIQVAVLATHYITQVSHDWRGRAPPHA